MFHNACIVNNDPGYYDAASPPLALAVMIMFVAAELSRLQTCLVLTTLVVLISLLEEKIGSQLLVLIASEVGLDSLIAVEAETA